MNIRNGIFTRIGASEFKIIPFRDDSPDEVNFVFLVDESMRQEPQEGFVPSAEGYFLKKHRISDLKNAYRVKTTGLYKGLSIEVFPKMNSLNVVISSRNRDAAIAAGLAETNVNWFTKDVLLSEIESLTEEYSASEYSTPMPQDLPVSKKL